MRLFVGGLPLTLTEEELAGLFTPYGVTEVKLRTNYNGTNQYCNLDMPDNAAAERAMRDLNGYQLHGRRIIVKPDEPNQKWPSNHRKPNAPATQQTERRSANRQQQQSPQQRTTPKNRYPWNNGEFPYRFATRPGFEPQPPQAHNQPQAECWDVAFDIEWEALNPIAANPCIDPQVDASKPMPAKGTGYSGYNRRWLTVGDQLAISPFTVKSAIANAFANLMGACYRVNTSAEKHATHQPNADDDEASQEKGQFRYNGKFKRHRADRAKSKAGIVRHIDEYRNGCRIVAIEPVEEILCKSELPTGLDTDLRIHAIVEPPSGKKKKPLLVRSDNMSNDKDAVKGKTIKEISYHGEYRFGMNAELKTGHLNKPYVHRFFHAAQTKEGEVVDWLAGCLRGENFGSDADMMKVVYMGSLRKAGPGKESDTRTEGIIWYDDLTHLKKGDWVYYEEFNGQVAAIGKNFLFKPLFLHEDTIPEGQKTCHRLDQLCPRCRAFGLVTKEETPSYNTKGYGGRFKAAALVCDTKADKADLENPACKSTPILYFGATDAGQHKTNVDLPDWKDQHGDLLCRQYLLPILGPPKSNKRDIDAYYDPNTGELKGPKAFKHGYQHLKNLADLDQCIAWYNTRLQEPNKDGKDFEYSHRLRSYAQYCREGLRFKGTVGLENAAVEEIAALITLLDHRIGGHGFKIGMAKSLGLGSVRGWIKRIWVRQPDQYQQWQSVPLDEDQSPEVLKKCLERLDPAWAVEVGRFQQCAALAQRLNPCAGADERDLCFPSPVKTENPGEKEYWKFLNSGV